MAEGGLAPHGPSEPHRTNGAATPDLGRSANATPEPGSSADDAYVGTWGAFFRALVAFSGPGYLIASGYIDPGNVATSLASGSRWGYDQLNVTLMASSLAMFLQFLSVKLGVVTQKDLAENCRQHLPWKLNVLVYILTECAIVATDIANLLGAAIALNLLFGLRLEVAVGLTAVDVLMMLWGWNARFARAFELVTIGLVIAVGLCFAVLTFEAQPDGASIFFGFLPNKTLLNPEALYYAAAVTGAICMPHNLILASHLDHAGTLRFTEDGVEDEPMPASPTSPGSTIVSVEREQEPLPASFRTLIPYVVRMSNLDSIIALTLALLINSQIQIVASAAFYPNEINEIPEAYHLFLKSFGAFVANIFAVALLISGIGSSMTGTLAGQVVMEGFLGPSFFKLQAWQRRLLTRAVAIVPAMLSVLLKGEEGVAELLVLSQVVLALQLPFTVAPLVYFTSSAAIMGVRISASRTGRGRRANGADASPGLHPDERTPLVPAETATFENRGAVKAAAVFCSLLILGCNCILLYQTLRSST
ncbi:natural resistance-associated macrophage protein-domain-containing protein [Hyaloraphidium curvatum]|nr:natural resistance-associated macrophage protein-domain-containing protein [Hyaloraphidium curvatum]